MGDARRSRQRQKNKGCGREKGRGGRRGTRGAAVSVRKKKTWGGAAGRGEGGGAGGGRAAQPSVSGGGGREKGDGIRTQGGAVGHWGDTRAGKGLCTKLVVCAPSPSAPPLPVNKYGEEKVVEEEKGEDSDALRVRVCVCVRARWSAHACVHAQRWQGLSRAWTEPQAACGKGPRVQMLQQACGEHAVRRTLRLLLALGSSVAARAACKEVRGGEGGGRGEGRGPAMRFVCVCVCVCVCARALVSACVRACAALARPNESVDRAPGRVRERARVQMLQQACGEHAVRRTLRLLCCLLRNVGRAPSLVAPRLPKCPSCSFLILSDLVVLAPRGHVLRGVSAFFFWAAKHRGVETVGTRRILF